MIYFVSQPDPDINISWHAQYFPEPVIDWYHGESKLAQELQYNNYKAGGPIDLVPRAQFNVGAGGFYYWEETIDW